LIGSRSSHTRAKKCNISSQHKTQHSLAANAVTASPFQSFRVLPAYSHTWQHWQACADFRYANLEFAISRPRDDSESLHILVMGSLHWTERQSCSLKETLANAIIQVKVNKMSFHRALTRKCHFLRSVVFRMSISNKAQSPGNMARPTAV